MLIFRWIEEFFLTITHFIYSYLPAPQITLSQIQNCKLIAHRGEHDNNKTIMENTIPAFTRALEEGVWGIEFDIRWTKDLIPIVFHDSNCLRLYQQNIKIQETSFSTLREQFPLIPTLQEIIELFGKKLHLMVELKQQYYSDPISQNNILKSLFKNLIPGKDYHFISLHPEMFTHITYPPSTVFLPIAYARTKKLEKLVKEKHYGGLTGHYLLLRHSIIRKYKLIDLIVGSGLVDSKNCLHREVAREVSYIFTNQASALQKYLNYLETKVSISKRF